MASGSLFQKLKVATVTTIFVGSFFTQLAYADVKNSAGGFLDFNLYPYLSDVDSDNTATINIAAKLPNRISYFSLLNISNQNSAGALEETENFYTEQNLRWRIAEVSPLDLTLQMNFRSGQDNDRHRLGFRWRINDTEALRSLFTAMNISWSINFHLLQIDNEDAQVWQMEHVFRMTFPYLTDRLYLAGFIDHTFNQDLPANFPSSPMVGEVQLGLSIVENLYVVAEYRVNQYRLSDVNNVAAGFEYKIKW